MTVKLFRRRWHFFLAASITVVAAANPSLVRDSRAQARKLTLINQDTSTRAIAVDSVTLKTEPFNTTSEVRWGNDGQTRVMLFAMGLDNGSSAEITASAEDGGHNLYSLTVENLAAVPEQSWATAVVVRLDDALRDVGDVLIRISYQGTQSNRVRV